jgi:histidine triad (HIT) family protein
MADDLTPEQIAEMQKKNCIFCKIVSGEVPSSKVYEDDQFLGILDIRPAAAGHVLFLPKEHVPILPLMAEEKMIAYLERTLQVAEAVRDAMICPRVTIMAASGWAAGQQAPHLMLHIIPREPNDGLDMLDVTTLTTPQADALALAPLFGQATVSAIKHRGRSDLLPKPASAPISPPAQTQSAVTAQQPAQTSTQTTAAQATTPAPAPPATTSTPTTPSTTAPVATPAAGTPAQHADEVTQEFDSPSEALQEALAMSPDLRRLIISQPDLVSDYVRKSPKLAKLFEGVNIRALGLMLQRQEQQVQDMKDREHPGQKKTAMQMTESELFAFISTNEGLRTWLLDHPDELAAHISENPRLQAFFAGIDIPETARRFAAWWQTQRTRTTNGAGDSDTAKDTDNAPDGGAR